MSADTAALPRRRELALLATLAAIQCTHILDFMIMMPLGPQLTRLLAISDAQFGLLVSAYTLAAGVSGLAATTYLDRFDRKSLLLVLYALFALATLACGLHSRHARERGREGAVRGHDAQPARSLRHQDPTIG